MKSLGNILKIIFTVILFLGLLIGIFYLLFFLDILKTPTYVEQIPVVGKIVTEKQKTPPKKVETKADLMQKENKDLKETIAKKDAELKEVQADSQDIANQLKTIADNEEKLKDEVISLNEKLLESQMRKENQAKVYKDMAKYYAEMNAKNAAEIITKLEMEHIIGILSELEADIVADIMQNMSEDKAAEITKKMLVMAP